jgi:hypothetical protein
MRRYNPEDSHLHTHRRENNYYSYFPKILSNYKPEGLRGTGKSKTR